MGWGNLPSEILTLIFKNLYSLFVENEDDEELGISVGGIDYFDRGRAIGQCAFVYQGWKLTAQKIHFSKLWLEDQTKIRIMAYKLSSSSRGLVKKIKYNVFGQIENENHRNNLIQFAKLFPYLEELQFEGNSSTFITIYNLLTSGLFPDLNAIIDPINRYQTDLYVSSILVMKNCVSEIMLEPENSCYKPFLNEDPTFNMNMFPKLRRLYIRSSYYIHDNNIANFIESIIPNIKIETLRLALGQSSPQNNNEAPLVDISKVNIKPSYSLKRLFFRWYDDTTYICDDNSLLFIMKKYPNLDALHYKSDIKVFEMKNYAMSSASIVQFLLYIFNM